jgi:hypothetical protein
MQYWIDRVRIHEGPTDVTVVPVSFVTANLIHHDQLNRLVAPEDQIVDIDVLPVQIIASIQTTLENSKFDAMMFPVVYRGFPVFEKRFYKKNGSGENVQQANMPIFNLNRPPEDTS